MPQDRTDREPGVTGGSGSLVRKIGPAIPLAIALLHGGIANTPGQGRPSQPPGGSITAPGSPVCGNGSTNASACVAPYPLLAAGHPVDWWFVFKLNSQAFPACGNGDTRSCPFDVGGSPNPQFAHFGQQFAYASSEHPGLQDGGQQCLGTTKQDPVGATFDEVYNGKYHYVVWNDQPYDDPGMACGKSDSCSGPWGHSKGLLAWNDDGNGLVMQVSTPDWPLAGSAAHPRRSRGNTLGCTKDNNVEVSQHFFAVRLNKDDLVTVLSGMANASIVTDAKDLQVVSNGGPADVQALVNGLGVQSKGTRPVTGMLSAGVEVISKPSKLAVPPWQMVSSVLGGVPLHVANWWMNPDRLASTTASNAADITCWDSSLQAPGAVESATSGSWDGKTFGLLGGDNPNGNHAKVGVSTAGNQRYTIFGDMNQEGSYNGPNCTVSQNGRGGMFYVLSDSALASSVAGLIGAGASVQ